MIVNFVRSCEPYQKAKSSYLLPIGIYQPLKFLSRWIKAINIAFVSDIPLDEGYDQIMVITDKLKK